MAKLIYKGTNELRDELVDVGIVTKEVKQSWIRTYYVLTGLVFGKDYKGW